MKRVGLLVTLGLLASCSKSAPSRPLLPPWEVLVTGVRPGNFSEPPALVVCEANGSGCHPVKPGLRLSGNKLVRTERGTSEFELDAVTRVEIAQGSELLLEDDGGRSIELRAGGISLTRNAPGNTGSLLVRMVDRTVELVGRAAIVAQLDNINRGQLFATQGVVNVAEPAGAAVPVRQFHPGEGAVFERKAPPDLHAVFAGAVSRFRQSVLATVDTPPPPPQAVVQPRGLGTMTARVPGTTAVVAGVRLAQHRVRAVVRDGVAQTEVEEVFHNDTDRVLEGRYVFPLPADATISGLTLFVGDEPVDGEVVEKKRAAAIFKGIVEETVRPRDPALLEWVRGSEFSLKIFPIPARGSRKVVLRYQQVLTADGPRQVYVYPLSFGAERRTPIDELSIDVELSDGGKAVQGVVASGYSATLQPGTSSSHVSMRASGSSPERDFAVSFKRPIPAATVATAEDGFVAIRMRAELPPDMPAPPFQRRDRVLVVDASHSQSNESFEGARQLALGIVRSLEPDERFALLLCDSACDAVPQSGLSAASGKALDDAKALLDGRKPSGASDIAGALVAAAERVPPGAPVQIVYVGDGAASAGELSVPSMARRVRPRFEQRKVDLRLLGAGASLDEVALSGLSRELSGSYEPVLSVGALAEQVEVLSAGLRSPLLVAPSLEASSLTEIQPRVLPNLRLGEELVVVGKASGNTPIEVTLRGTLNRIPYALTRPVTAQTTAGALPFAARLWAESRIRDLQTSADPRAFQEVIELSKRFRVMSRETSWLVLENEQMFAEFGIPRTKPSDSLPPPAEAPEARAALAQELDSLDLGALDATSGSGSRAEAPGAPAKKEAADRATPSAAAKPASPAADAPAPVAPSPPSRSRGGGSSGLGSTESKATGAEASGSGASAQVPAPRSKGTTLPRPPGVLVPRPVQPPANVAVSRPGDDGFFTQNEPALDKLRAELAASPDSRKRHEALVRGLLLRGRFAPALAAAARFVELDPDSAAARELLSYAAVANGDVERAIAAVDAMTEAEPAALKAHGRAARAFEARGDEARACAHWRSVFELAPTSDAAIFESLRCRARVMADRAGALADAKAVPRPGPLLQRLLPLLESGEVPAFQKSSGSAGQLEVTLSCEAQQGCPYVIVITPTGTVFSPWTPALGRSSATSFAFSGLLTGTYRIIRIGGSPDATGKVEVRALNARSSFAFGPDRPRTVATTQVTMAPAGGLGTGQLGRF